jgi:hypothetical protein
MGEWLGRVSGCEAMGLDVGASVGVHESLANSLCVS